MPCPSAETEYVINSFLGTVGRTYGHNRFNGSAARRDLGYFNIHTECILYIFLCHYTVSYTHLAKALITASFKGSANSAATTFMYQPKKPEGLEKFSKLGK